MATALEQLSLWPILALFGLAAGAILVAGTKLEALADALGRATRLGQVFAGMILLAVSTSLPEIATTVTATTRGEVDMAVNNLLGGVIVQTMVLALADAFGRPAALTRTVPSFGLLIQGVGLTLLLAIVAIAATLEARFGDALPAAIGPVVVACVYALMQYVTVRARDRPGWTPASKRSEEGSQRDEDSEEAEEAPSAEGGKKRPLPGLVLRYLVASAFVLVGGYVVVLTTERIAALTGTGTSFLGFTLVAFVTSLPEVATTLAATRRNRPVAAVSNIFGSNSFDVALLVLVAILSDKGVFTSNSASSIFAATLGVLMTGVYLIGMLERRNRSFLRMGWDSIVVLVVGGGGLWLLHAFTTQQ